MRATRWFFLRSPENWVSRVFGPPRSLGRSAGLRSAWARRGSGATRALQLRRSPFFLRLRGAECEMDRRESARKERSRIRFERHRLYRAAYPKRAAAARAAIPLAESDVQEYFVYLEQVRPPSRPRYFSASPPSPVPALFDCTCFSPRDVRVGGA